MNERIRQIRKENKLSQEDFGKKIGIGKTSVSKLESGENNPSDRTIILICKEFDINEEWLRTGKGEMKAPINEDDRYSHNLSKLAMTDDETIIRWVNMIAETNPDALKEIENFMKKLLDIEN